MFGWIKPQYEIQPENWRDDMPERVQENPVLRHFVWGPMHRHKDNYMAAFCGETGSGKSYAALATAEAVDPNFTVDQIAFSVIEFLELVIDDSYGPGSIIVFEEASVEAGSDEYMTKKNKALRQVAEIWRHQRRGALFTYPAFKRLDPDVRARCAALIQLDELNESVGTSVGRYKYIQQDSDTGEIYRHTPLIGGVKYKQMEFTLPSEDLIEAYEEKKSNYTQDKNLELLEGLIEDAKDEEESNDDARPQDIGEEIIAEDKLDEYINSNNGQEYIDRDLIELDYGIGRRMSKKVKKFIQREVQVSAI